MSASLPADDEEVLLGDDAVDHVAETWQDVGMGKANAEVISPWFIVRRAGGDYSFFLSLVDDTAVTILDDNATTEHIPKEHRPEAVLDAHVDSVLGRAFNAPGGGGTYPLPDDGVYVYNFIEEEDGDRETHKIEIGLTSPAVALDGKRIDPEGRDDA